MNLPVMPIPKGHELYATTRPKSWADAPRFHCIGGDKIKGRVPPFKDLYITFRDMSKTAHWFWWSLIEARNIETNTVLYRAKDNSESKKITKAYKELYDLGLIKRVSRQKYLINPKAIFPLFDNFKKVLERWMFT